MTLYNFIGRTKPEWMHISFDFPFVFSVQGKSGNCTVTLLSGPSLLSLMVETENGVNDLATLRNEILPSVRAVFDSYTYLKGQPIEIEITGAVNTVTNELNVFYDAVQEIADEEDKRPVDMEKVIRLAIMTPELRYALSNLHDAMIFPDKTGLHCYRAIESIWQSFKHDEAGNDKEKKAWNDLRKALRIDKSWLTPLASHSKLNRHNEVWEASGQERVALMKRAWTVIDRYILYLINDKKGLPEHHEILQGAELLPSTLNS